MNTSPMSSTPGSTRTIKILFVTANPSDTATLRLDEEIRLLTSRVRRGRYRELFEIHIAPALRATDLPTVLLEHRPDIVHFSGHGSKEGELYFVEDRDLTTQPVSAEALRRVFESFQDSIKCVVLNACFSAIQAEAIASSIPFVVGMSREVTDAVAIAFAAGFYEAISFGKNLVESVALGRAQMALSESIPADSTSIPRLYVRSSVDPSRIRFAAADAFASQDTIHGDSPVPSGQTQRIGSIKTDGDNCFIQVGQYGRGDVSEVASQQIDGIQINGRGNRIVVEQKKA